MSRDYTPDLEEALIIIKELQTHVTQLDTKLLTFQPPVIDRTGGKWNQDEVLGFKKFVETVNIQVDVLELVSQTLSLLCIMLR
jgi:hypothetical protein